MSGDNHLKSLQRLKSFVEFIKPINDRCISDCSKAGIKPILLRVDPNQKSGVNHIFTRMEARKIDPAHVGSLVKKLMDKHYSELLYFREASVPYVVVYYKSAIIPFAIKHSNNYTFLVPKTVLRKGQHHMTVGAVIKIE